MTSIAEWFRLVASRMRFATPVSHSMSRAPWTNFGKIVGHWYEKSKMAIRNFQPAMGSIVAFGSEGYCLRDSGHRLIKERPWVCGCSSIR